MLYLRFIHQGYTLSSRVGYHSCRHVAASPMGKELAMFRHVLLYIILYFTLPTGKVISILTTRNTTSTWRPLRVSGVLLVCFWVTDRIS
jgi:hypothetical protein